eukprot:CAMPEP_0170275078 /NCGR_PEP_ID=MMETSP0116_2-20130129/37514_1 /TAXON_ID=400756 /ORGANISM="Durinskia baltica, Strain CSIRO CS-38" /LENGTH=104 /DNA_ID=CAMNT_0010526331 /DNA_START=132 /DNA_END=443 /DNA_ORIENTATION=+
MQRRRNDPKPALRRPLRPPSRLDVVSAWGPAAWCIGGAPWMRKGSPTAVAGTLAPGMAGAIGAIVAQGKFARDPAAQTECAMWHAQVWRTSATTQPPGTETTFL